MKRCIQRGPGPGCTMPECFARITYSQTLNEPYSRSVCFTVVKNKRPNQIPLTFQISTTRICKTRTHPSNLKASSGVKWESNFSRHAPWGSTHGKFCCCELLRGHCHLSFTPVTHRSPPNIIQHLLTSRLPLSIYQPMARDRHSVLLPCVTHEGNV